MSELKNPFLPGKNPHRGAFLLPFGTVINGVVRTDWLAYPGPGSDDRYILLYGTYREEVSATALAEAVAVVTDESSDYAMWNEGAAEPIEETRQNAIEQREYHSPPPRLYLSLSRLSSRIIDGSETGGRQMLAFLFGVRERRLTQEGTGLTEAEFSRVKQIIECGEARGNIVWFHTKIRSIAALAPLLDTLNGLLERRNLPHVPSPPGDVQRQSWQDQSWQDWVVSQLVALNADVEVQ